MNACKTNVLSRPARELSFFSAGLAVAIACLALSYYSLGIALFRPFDAQAPWVQWCRYVIASAPWIACVAIVTLRTIKGNRISAVSYMVGTIVPFACITAFIVMFVGWDRNLHWQRFDAAVWRSSEDASHDSEWPPRLTMADDLVASRVLDGLAKNEVVELLGPPRDNTSALANAACEIEYYLGPEHGFCAVDREWLFVRFDADGKVVHYGTRPD